jgi:hypothetical protein
MKNIYLRVLFALLLVLTLCFTISCQGPDGPSSGQNNPPIQTPVEITDFLISDAYVLVRPDAKTSDELNALMLLSRGLESAYGHSFNKGTDLADVAEFEILVGQTNRPETQAIVGTLGHYDWTYQVVSPNVIVICGGSPEATLTATQAFLRDVIGYTEDADKQVTAPGNAMLLKVGSKFQYNHEYAVTSFKLGLHDISDYTLVASDTDSDEVLAIVKHFIRVTGIEIPVTSLREYKSGPAIFFGCTGKAGEHLNISGYSNSRYYIQQDGDNIVIDFSNAPVAKAAAKRFIDVCTPADDFKGDFALSLDGDQPLTGVYIPEGTNSLVLSSVTKTEVAPGVFYEEHLYYDPNGKPVRAYILTVEKGAATIATSLPKDENQIGRLSNMLNQVKDAANHGKNVLAGINADFFDIDYGTNQMLGLCVKDGVLLHEVSGRPWFGITKDGTPVIGADYVYKNYAGNLMTAVGGSNIVLKDDKPFHISIDHDFGYTRHPRSAVGYKPDGSIVLLVVDGRQAQVSNGAALADLADILAMQGCSNALNLDGGGSSTFVLKGEDGSYSITNSPSDPNPRPVADGLIVILPDKED